MNADGDKNKKIKLPIIIVSSIIVFIILVTLIIAIALKETAYGLWHGMFLSEWFSSEKNPNKNMSDKELAIYAKETDFCEGDSILDKLEVFWEKLTPESIDSVCEGQRAIKSITERYEEKYAKFNLKINPGMILATITNTYDASISEEGLNIQDSKDMMKEIFKNNKITRIDIKNLVDHYVYNEKYDYYIWTIVGTTTKEEIDPDTQEVVKKITKKWACVKNESENHYLDMDKLSIYLRFGVGEIDYAGNTITNIFGDLTDNPATVGYEYEKNMALSYQKTPAWCKKNGIEPVIPPNSENVTNELDSGYNSESIKYFEKFDENSIENYQDYLQYADYQNMKVQDVFTPVKSTSRAVVPLKDKFKTFELSYKTGFIFQKFSKYLGIFENTITPKNIEREIDIIKNTATYYDAILGYGDGQESVGGLDGSSIAEIALAMYYNNHDIYNNNNLCYISPDDTVRTNTYNGIKSGDIFRTDCNGFVGLVLRAALGMGPTTGTNGGDVTFFSPSSYEGSWGPRDGYKNDFELIKFRITTEETYSLMATNELKPGDLIGYNDGSDTHIAIYIGEGKIIENTGPTDSCGNNQSIKYRDFKENAHYNDGSVITIWRYKSISMNYAGTDPSNYTFGRTNVSACSLNSYKIRLISCSSQDYSQNYNFNKTLPGGASPQVINGVIRYIANEPISVERYIKGLITSEISGNYEIEAIKMQMIMAKTYMFNAVINSGRAGIDTSSNEILVQTGECFQVYHDYKYTSGYINSSNKTKIDTAYSNVSNVMITSLNGNLISAQYGAKLQNSLNAAAKAGATYIDMFNTVLSTYSKGSGYIYKGTILGQC